MNGVEIHGYAIVSRDDRIADAAGDMPESLRNDADWTYFQAGLDASDWVALGRSAAHGAALAVALLTLLTQLQGFALYAAWQPVS